MKSYKTPETQKELFQPFSFQLGGKEYVKSKLDYDLYKAIQVYYQDTDETFKNAVIALVGPKAYESDGPWNPYEVSGVINWIIEEIIPTKISDDVKEDKDAKINKKKEKAVEEKND